MATINFGIGGVSSQGGGGGSTPRRIGWVVNSAATTLTLINGEENAPLGLIDTQTPASFFSLSGGGIVLPNVGIYRAVVNLSTDNTGTLGDARGTASIISKLDGVDIGMSNSRFYIREVQSSGRSQTLAFTTTLTNQIFSVDVSRSSNTETVIGIRDLVVEIEFII